MTMTLARRLSSAFQGRFLLLILHRRF
uniref:Uncharacterized protein n=1 Tax=Triticum urartu TaxID=4572 RepID=A0A8R7PA85_TRIUA